jgi:hypothetical protein
VSRLIGHGTFRLGGGASQTYGVPITTGGRALLRTRGVLKTHVVVAIPGGRRTAVLTLRG